MRAAGDPRRLRTTGLLLVTVIIALLGGCAAGEVPTVPPTPSAGPSSVTVEPTPSPAGGRTLRELGFVHGPIDVFSVPLSAVTTARVDQPNVVSLVFAQPSPTEVGDYLRAALPPAGFEITADSADQTTFSFAGHGWSGSFTASADTSAVVMRPE
jgi:hypothetical protein